MRSLRPRIPTPKGSRVGGLFCLLLCACQLDDDVVARYEQSQQGQDGRTSVERDGDTADPTQAPDAGCDLNQALAQTRLSSGAMEAAVFCRYRFPWIPNTEWDELSRLEQVERLLNTPEPTPVDADAAEREACIDGTGTYFDDPRRPTELRLCPAQCLAWAALLIERVASACDGSNTDQQAAIDVEQLFPNLWGDAAGEAMDAGLRDAGDPDGG